MKTTSRNPHPPELQRYLDKLSPKRLWEVCKPIPIFLKELSEEELDSMQEYHYLKSRIENGKRIQFTQNKYYSGRKETKKVKTDYYD